MMKRIDLVFKKLCELSKEAGGVDAQSLADMLGLSRANVSSDLNKLCEMGWVEKSCGRPVIFMPLAAEKKSSADTTLDKLIKDNNSLAIPGEQAKAAILYPPRGMHTLILGDTGVGKTMFAAIMHKFAVEMGIMGNNSPFITFNCADYSNNPQLLISQLFGVKKGAYTGADSDRIGLIEKAHGGILFLDEVHRLPSEGQEMFFTFMDKGIFRRLGEADAERKADVLIISATTENPNSVLLKTFTRRIPMIIRIPGINERGMEERFNLITNFFTEESCRLDREILVSVNSMRSFLSYNCTGNIGQLKTDIQLSCAKAYADFLSHKKDCIKINSPDLPAYVREGLYKETEHRQIWNRLIGINNRYLIFNKNRQEFIYDDNNDRENIYEIIDSRMNGLKDSGINNEELERLVQKDIDNYFTSYLNKVNNQYNKTNLINMVGQSVVDVAEQIKNYCEKKLEKSISQKVYLGMVIHIDAAIDRVRRNKKIVNPNLQRIRIEHEQEFNAALDCLGIIEKAMDISMPIDEAGFLAMFLSIESEIKNIEGTSVGVMVIAHGNSTATSMAEVANGLLGVDHALGVNMPLDESPEQVLQRIREQIRVNIRRPGFIFLVDMGSLTTFGEIIEKEMGFSVRVIPLVSTLHVLEAVRKAVLGHSLDDIFNDVSGISDFFAVSPPQPKYDEAKGKFAIVTICTTGEGSAIAVKNFLASHLKYDDSMFDIVPLNLVGSDDINTRLKRISREKQILCIVSPFLIGTNIPQYSIGDVLNLKAIKLIQGTIDIQSTYLKMGETLKNHLSNIDGAAAFYDIKTCIKNIEKILKINMTADRLIGITLHIGCMMDRLKKGEINVMFPDRDSYILQNIELFNAVKDAVEFINKKYSINISKDEICYIMEFFNPKNLEDM